MGKLKSAVSFDIVGKIIGGIGLFFIGIDLMRRGFQAAAGTSLRRIISDYTDTTPRALFAGFLLASAVQSSSAVILTMIGFLNARILRLRQAIVIDYGWPRVTALSSVLPEVLGLVVAVALTTVAVVRRHPLGFAGAAFFLILAPTSSVLPIVTEIAAEHRM